MKGKDGAVDELVVSFYVWQIWGWPAYLCSDYPVSDSIFDLDPDSRAIDLAVGVYPYGVLLLPDAVSEYREAPGGELGFFESVEPGEKLV